mgnify:CR=1 FL=1
MPGCWANPISRMRPWNTVLTNNLPRTGKDDSEGPGLSGDLDPESRLSQQRSELVCQDPISGDPRPYGEGDGMLHVQRIYGLYTERFPATGVKVCLGWIEETSFNGRKRYLRSLLRFDDRAVQADTTEATKRIRQYCPSGQDKSVQHNKQVNKPINKQFNSFKEKRENIEKKGQVLE